jgi:hypothetical protein
MIDFRPWIARLTDAERTQARESLSEVVVRAQLASANLAGDHAAKVGVDYYTGEPDFDAVGKLWDNFDMERPPGSWLAFVGARPGVDGEALQIHCFTPDSDEPVPTLWLKARRQPALAEEWNVATNGTGDQADIANRALLDWTASNIGRRGADIEFGTDIPLESGPNWLMEPLGVEGTTLRMPVLVTDMDFPAPFGGQFFMKVLSPEALLAWALYSDA